MAAQDHADDATLGKGLTVSAPAPLDAQHRIDDFDCGSQSLNDWLRKHALRNQASGASRTFVVRDGERDVAYYALASSAVALDSVTGKLRRNMPDPVPVVVLGRLAVDVAYQGHGLGRALLQDAGRRVVNAARSVSGDCSSMRSMRLRRLSISASASIPRRSTR